MHHPSRLREDPISLARENWDTHWGPEPVSAMAAVTSIFRVEQIVLGRLNALLAPSGLTFARYEALMLLHFTRTGALPLGKMGARLQVHPTSVTNLVDKLEAAGLVRRARHDSDRRTTLAEITPHGRAVAIAATERLNEARFGLDTLADDDLETISSVLEEVRRQAGDF